MTPWDRSQLALHLAAIDPGLGGILLRARSGPVRDAFMRILQRVLPASVRLRPSMEESVLLGGLDPAATLASGTATFMPGLLEQRTSTLIMPMAERCNPELSSILAQALDAGRHAPLVLLDEGVDADESVAEVLSDRVAIHLNLDEVALNEISFSSPPELFAVTHRLPQIDTPDDVPEQLVMLCSRLGISSLRAPYLALRTARAHAAYSGNKAVEHQDILTAIELVLAPRATQFLQDQEEPRDNDQCESSNSSGKQENLTLPDEMVIEAMQAVLSPDVLAHLASGRSQTSKGSGSGHKKTGNRRGRPLPARNRQARSGDRIDLMATLRAGIPWQTARKKEYPERRGAIIRPQDLRARRYQDHSDRLLIFVVDASGSAALARLGEAKGAVEILLAEAYARRDHVSLIAFRGDTAEELLPPTRSLVQTKRRLAELPGGGGTPVAAGLRQAHRIADQASRRGLTPSVVLLTDGRSNIALDGSADRGKAAEDATAMARNLARLGVDSLVIDTGNRPEQALSALARHLHGQYITLPRADARRLSEAVTDALGS